MGSTAKRSDPALWDRVKRAVTAGDKGGEPGQWSARKAQIAVQDYKRQGGGYEGRKRADNSLQHWTKEEWGTGSGRRSRDSGERYLPKEAREHLSPAEYRRTSAKKRRDMQAGRQFSDQPKDVARKTARHRQDGAEPSKADLLEEARRRGIQGRSRMDKAALKKALGR
ncbi:DUF5872 domain-containing protein [Paracraurococcus ruber]|uniref:DUF5872 domain-containing protein n=1 Tax=Paracraurococcus ruber TaxID=77675 RepID=A0ABS1CXF5_9PROT|nr:DUF5872 domain-containing protein [Paracraurococcus ruber]MBK1659094.1 hypothetical protein [Paracraurococcus ruber]TDG32542.1 hypothetical protein E2C05_06795 [Paracraurococcus ruber]